MTKYQVTAQEKRILPWLAAVGFFMQALDGTILNTALPTIATDFQVSPLQMQAAIISYMLTVAMLIPASGWLADRFGTRHVFLFSIVLFSAGSLFCAESTSLTQLVIARIIQGVGGALLVPVGRLAILRVFPKEEFLRAMSMVVIPGLIGPLIGPLLGGLLVQHTSWPWIFLINLPIGLVGCILAFFFMPNIREITAPFDWKGYLCFSSGIVLLSIAIQRLGEAGASLVAFLALALPGLFALYAYFWHSQRHPHALFSRTLFKNPSFRIGIIGNLIARLGSGALPFLTPLFLQVALGFSPTHAGLTMMPIALGAMSTKLLANRVVLRFGYRPVLMTNTLLLGALITGFATVNHATPYALLLFYLTLLGVFNSLQFTAMNTLTLGKLERDEASSGNSLLSVVMQLSMSLGVAISATLFSWFYGASVSLHNLQATSQQQQEIVSAFHATYITVGCLSMLATLIFRHIPQKLIPQNNPELTSREEEPVIRR
nr:multidrug transporter subunit MdtD [uncultured Tolumonas sp.]